MNTYLDDGVNAQLTDYEAMVQRFIALFDEEDGSPVLVADEDDIIDILNDAAVLLETDYSGAE